jgi:hypothetical protein
MAAILTAAITSGGTVLAAVVAGAAGYLGARRGTRAGLESGRVERMWENRVSLYEELAAWVRTDRPADKPVARSGASSANGFANETGRNGGDAAGHGKRTAASVPGQRNGRVRQRHRRRASYVS